MRRHIVALLIVAAPLAAMAQTADVKPSASGLDLTAMNRSVDACTDFYESVRSSARRS